VKYSLRHPRGGRELRGPRHPTVLFTQADERTKVWSFLTKLNGWIESRTGNCDWHQSKNLTGVVEEAANHIIRYCIVHDATERSYQTQRPPRSLEPDHSTAVLWRQPVVASLLQIVGKLPVAARVFVIRLYYSPAHRHELKLTRDGKHETRLY
jgi:hypothetical protein